MLKNSGGQTVASTSYEYNAKGSVSRKVTTGVSGASDNSYTYDDAARLTSWSVAGGATTTYAWDASGNRTKVNGATATYDQRNRLISDNGTDYSLQPAGLVEVADQRQHDRGVHVRRVRPDDQPGFEDLLLRRVRPDRADRWEELHLRRSGRRRRRRRHVDLRSWSRWRGAVGEVRDPQPHVGLGPAR
ncbi:RHS repeat protein [Nocardioides sp. W3-2-3]|uniref:RHS repeat domain-containing protein n=1 Tax=Nocardioides convexus TaxID=2712224 RepID=UPI00241878C7|nr:RHS repeat domain-containing protein [Nocardioides convexus]NHA00293.1 RHS repeat protein [Nocardioides convexus]